jgi:hypothetical protein
VINDDPQPPPKEIDQARGVVFDPDDQRQRRARRVPRGLKDNLPAGRCAAAAHGTTHHRPTDACPIGFARHLFVIEDQHITDDRRAHGHPSTERDGVENAESHAPHGAEIVIG